uniref:C2H2-type domain-containing protein n=1 Tax=Anabas testudineus TaxID=64144 RepID=A0A7N6BBH1_ANATE
MSSVQYLREFVIERLNAAAEEIFGVFETTILEYEEEIDRQRRLLDIVWKPEIKLHRIELPEQHVCKEEEDDDDLFDQQFSNQERNSSLDQEDPGPPQIKEEQEERSTSQEVEHLILKQETENVTWIPAYEESDDSEPEPLSDEQILCQSQDQEGKHVDSGSTRNAEPQVMEQHHDNTCHSDYAHDSSVSEPKCSTTHKTSIKSGKDFKSGFKLKIHLKTHTGEKSFTCSICKKTFICSSKLERHMITHTGEKPYLCSLCEKDLATARY